MHYHNNNSHQKSIRMTITTDRAWQTGRHIWLATAIALAAGTGLTTEAQTRLSRFDQSRLINARHTVRNAGKDFSNNGATTLPSMPGATALQVSADLTTGVILEIQEGTDPALLEEAGLRDYSSTGNYYFGRVALDKAETLAACEGVKQISLSRTCALRNDKGRQEGRLEDVQTGVDLPQAYNGKGIIVGLMDAGFDPSHVTFMDSEGNSRVMRLWQYSESGTCRSYTDATIGNFSTDSRYETHGTHVLGTITGSCRTTDKGNDYHGVAPEADIAIGCGYFSNDNILKAVRAISEYARMEGKPCVINLSLGDNFGPHDGTDTFTAALNDLAADDNTTIFVAAGNEGDQPIAVTKAFKEGDCMVQTFLQNILPGYIQARGFIDIWSNDDRPLKVYVDLYENNDFTTPSKSYEIPVNGHYHVAQGTIWSQYIEDRPDLSDETFNRCYNSSVIGGYGSVEEYNNRYHVNMIAHLQIKTYTGKEAVTALRVEGEPGQTAYIYTPMSEMSFTSRGVESFTEGGGDGTISNMGSGTETIAVGAYCTRNSKQDYYGSTPEGEISAFSSWGRLSDGRELPDICAPGQVIISAENYYTVSSAGYDDLTTVTGANNRITRHYWTSLAGTSMAAPYATGVGALMLSADPTLTTEEIREIMKQTATAPETPAVQWGAGKINAYEAVKAAYHHSQLNGIGGVTDNAEGGISLNLTGHNTYEAFAPEESRLTATVTSLSGSTARSFHAEGNTLTADLEGLGAGVYILTVEGEKGRATQKVTVR